MGGGGANVSIYIAPHPSNLIVRLLAPQTTLTCIYLSTSCTRKLNYSPGGWQTNMGRPMPMVLRLRGSIINANGRSRMTC